METLFLHKDIVCRRQISCSFNFKAISMNSLSIALLTGVKIQTWNLKKLLNMFENEKTPFIISEASKPATLRSQTCHTKEMSKKHDWRWVDHRQIYKCWCVSDAVTERCVEEWISQQRSLTSVDRTRQFQSLGMKHVHFIRQSTSYYTSLCR